MQCLFSVPSVLTWSVYLRVNFVGGHVTLIYLNVGTRLLNLSKLDHSLLSILVLYMANTSHMKWMSVPELRTYYCMVFTNYLF